jgi:hypothetical protein
MTRTVRTLLLSAAALGALATAAVAAPTTSPANTHATARMHAPMMGDLSVHESLLDDPTMQAHMAEYGVDMAAMRADCPMVDR